MPYLKQNLSASVLTLLCLSLLAIPGGGCGGGSGGGGGTTGSTNLQGTIALNDGSVGTLNVTLQSTVAKSFRFSLIREAAAQTGTVPATGDCISPTCTIPNLSGTYDPSTGALNLSGVGTGSGCGGTTTNFTGTVTTGGSGGSGGGMSGRIQDSGGGSIGGFSGVFTTDSSGGAVSYCGIAVADGQSAFNVTVAEDGSLAGSAQPIAGSVDKEGVTFTGQVTGSTFQACTTNKSTSQAICGTIAADGSVNGKFVRDDAPGVEGCFVGNSSVCTTGTLPAPCSGPTAVCTFPTCP